MDVHNTVFPFLRKVHSVLENKKLEDKERKAEFYLVRDILQQLLKARRAKTYHSATADDRPRPSVLDSAAVIKFPASESQ